MYGHITRIAGKSSFCKNWDALQQKASLPSDTAHVADVVVCSAINTGQNLKLLRDFISHPYLIPSMFQNKETYEFHVPE